MMLKYNIYLCRSEQEYMEIWIFLPKARNMMPSAFLNAPHGLRC